MYTKLHNIMYKDTPKTLSRYATNRPMSILLVHHQKYCRSK